MRKNELADLIIESLTLDGQGIGHVDGMVLFVPDTAPGDQITARIVKVKKRYAFGRLENIKTPSGDRQDNDCPAYPSCGGCSLRHISYEAELKMKSEHVADCLKRIGKIDIKPLPIVQTKLLRYRNNAKYPLEKTKDGLKIGFYGRRSHRVINCRDCLLQPECFETIINIFEKWINKYKISIYDERENKGLLRHIYIRQAVSSRQIMVCPVINGQKLPFAKELIELLLESQPEIKSIAININEAGTNVILGEKSITLWGSDYITDFLCGLKFRLSPLSFYQVNSQGAEILYKKAIQYAGLTGQETVLDLYCGAGTISLVMASKAKSVIGIELIPQAIEDAKVNAQINSIENARFICADAAEAAQQLKAEGINPDVIILDPPRKGCAAELLKTVADMEPKRIVYVSCDAATLARDLAIMRGLGYETVEATPVDMFPRTGHVETVVLMSRVNK